AADPAPGPAVVAAEPGIAVEPAPRPRHWAPPSTEQTRLILVRHGETALSAERRFSGRGDPELTEKGQAQALAVAARLSTLLGDDRAQLISSPLRRARQTADEIAAVLGTSPVTVEDALCECDFGDWEGHTFAEVRDRWPAELDAWLASTAVAPPGGESIDEVATRTLPAVAKLREAYHGQAIVVVGHVTGIKLVLRHALDGGTRFLHQLHLDPAGVSIVDSWADGGVSVKLVNDTSHLGRLAT
ncbi:MAG: histidine phosphatase family protein, partial [Micromonosporaceae bacterium]